MPKCHLKSVLCYINCCCTHPLDGAWQEWVHQAGLLLFRYLQKWEVFPCQNCNLYTWTLVLLLLLQTHMELVFRLAAAAAYFYLMALESWMGNMLLLMTYWKSFVANLLLMQKKKISLDYLLWLLVAYWWIYVKFGFTVTISLLTLKHLHWKIIGFILSLLLT